MKNMCFNFRYQTQTILYLMTLAVVFNSLPAHAGMKNTEPTTQRGSGTVTEQSGFYCNAKALNKTERERYNQLTRKLAQARTETKELPDGYALRLGKEMVPLAELAEWIAFESKCCPFFGFEIELQQNSGPLWLKLRGSEGVKLFIRSEFGMQ